MLTPPKRRVFPPAESMIDLFHLCLGPPSCAVVIDTEIRQFLLDLDGDLRIQP